MPEIHVKPNSATKISFRTCANGVNSSGTPNTYHSGNLEQLDWHQIEVGQRNIEGQYQYYIKISGTEVFTRDNNQPISLINVHALIGTFDDLWFGTFRDTRYTDCELRNIQGKVFSIFIF